MADTPSPAAVDAYAQETRDQLVLAVARADENGRQNERLERERDSLRAQLATKEQETREACALLAEEHAKDNQRAKDFVATDERSAAIFSQRRDEAECIAAAIRASGTGEG